MLQLGKTPSAAPLVAGRASLDTFKRMSRAAEECHRDAGVRTASFGILTPTLTAYVTLDKLFNPKVQLSPILYGRQNYPLVSLL